jgi:hypothetical protein
VPKSTVYHWARVSRLIVPSVSADKVKLWSYRDLVLLRFVAWLRTNRVSAASVKQVLKVLKDTPIDLDLRIGGGRVFGLTSDANAIIDILSDQIALAGEISAMLPEFHLAASEVDGLGNRMLWGPDLVRPSENTRINPDVLAGEPFVKASRIPTAALFALKARNLSVDRIASLYMVDPAIVAEAQWLEESVRAGARLDLAA